MAEDTNKGKTLGRKGKGMLFRTQKWKELGVAAKILYLYIKAKYSGSNNG